MILQRVLSIPIFLYVDNDILTRANEIFGQNNLVFDNPLVLSGPTETEAIALRFIQSMNFPERCLMSIASNTANEVAAAREASAGRQSDVIIGVGGGKVLDVAKMAAFRQRLPFISIPTTLSNDGIASPIAVIKENEPGFHNSIGAQMPTGVIIDLELIKRAPVITTQAGVGDLISNISAIEDWRLANRLHGEKIDSVALLLSRIGADKFIHFIQMCDQGVNLGEEPILRRLAEGLTLSGLAMAIAGSSRPCSGAEHLISHALDHLLPKPGAHGLQVLAGTFFAQKVRGQDDMHIKEVLRKLQVPVSPADLNIPQRVFIEAIELAPKMRPGRVTVLDTLDRDSMHQIVEEIYGT